MNRGVVIRIVAALAILMCTQASSLRGQEAYNGGPGLANMPNAVGAGTRVLLALKDNLNTKDARTGDRFRARTLEPLATRDGRVLPAGLEVRGHVDKVEAARQAGRARLWLTFDEIRTPGGWTPLVADLVDIPGVHSVKVDAKREGEITAPTSKHQQEAEAAAAGAFAGAAGGVAAHSGKDAAMGAAAGAATAFMVESGLGQELTLPRETKLEVILDRALYLGRI